MLVMLVDDSRSSLAQLQRLITAAVDARMLAFCDPEEALTVAPTKRCDIVVVDYQMPRVDGIEFIKRMRQIRHYERIPIVMLTSNNNAEIRLEALKAGASDFLSKSCDPVELQIKLRNLIALSDAIRKLDDQAAWLASEVEAATRSLLEREEEMIFRLSLAVEYRDNDTGEHTLRVAKYSRAIAEELGLPSEQCRAIYLAAPLHDVGKVAIPDRILLKPGSLTTEETHLVRTHAAIGERILGSSSSSLMNLAAEIAGNHHERWDGTGYPRKLKGNAIPLCARIVAVADVFDALTTERRYKKAMSHAAALTYLDLERGRHFDPNCVDAFLVGFKRDHPGFAAEDETPRRAVVSAVVGS